MKAAFYTLGCKVNQYETNGMIQEFIKHGYEIVEFHEKADIYVINTCTVTNMSDRKSRQILRRTKQLNKNSVVVAVGCYAQVGKDKLEEIPEIDLILGTNEKSKMLSYIEEYLKTKNKIEVISDVMKQKDFDEFGEVTYTDKTRAVIKVQDGCDRFCSYCIIPYARGRVRSRKIENVIDEIKHIAQKGIKEVVITGIHVASYGRDLKEDIGLIDLLEKINEVDGIERIRLGSLEPMIITEEFIKRLSKLEKICHHFHLSLQSGCTETLKRMNRKYTIQEFTKVVELLRKTYPDVELTTDIIVGFPGETEEEFKTTYNYLKEIKFYKMHVFQYSPRKGTKAAVMENQISPEIKAKRSKELIELSNKNQEEINKQYIGKELKVLFEECENGIIKGHTSNYIMVEAEGTENNCNKIINVEIEKAEHEALVGKIKKVTKILQ